jgi:hypothetical protein
MDEDSKVCSHCKKTKLLWQFGKNKSSADGHHHTCKACVVERSASKKRKAYVREYVENRIKAGNPSQLAWSCRHR